MDIERGIRDSLNDPAELERIYRKSPKTFRECFDTVYEDNPKCMVLRVWKERLSYEKTILGGQIEKKAGRSDILLIIGLSLFAGTCLRLPLILNDIDPFPLIVKNYSFAILVPVSLFFALKNTINIKLFRVVVGIFAVSFLFINVVPDFGKLNDGRYSDTSMLSLIHAPFFLWTIVGVMFVGNFLGDFKKRMDYLKWNGEMIVYLPILIGGISLLSFLIMILFHGLGDDKFIEWYFRYVLIYVMTGSVITATYLAWSRNKDNQRVTPIVAKILSPLFLTALTIHLIVIFIQGENPFVDREFLLVYLFS